MATRDLEIIKKGSSTYGHLDGFLYVASDRRGDVQYWKCRRHKECSARVTSVNTGRNIMIRKGGSAESHSHGPNPEEVEALRIMASVKRKATADPERPPSAVMRVAENAEPAVQAHLPDQSNIRKTIRRERLRNLPLNPTTIEELQELPNEFKRNLNG